MKDKVRSSKILIIDGQVESAESLQIDHEDSIFLRTTENLIEDVVSVDPKLIILDIDSDQYDGISIFRDLMNNPATKNVSILVVTGREEAVEVGFGFKMSPENFLLKPFSSEKLDFVVNQILQNRDGQDSRDDQGSLTLDSKSQKAAVVDGGLERNLALTPIEFKILEVFHSNAGQVLSREQIMDEVWGQAAIELTERSVDTHVSAIRRKLGTCRYAISSVYGMGYRFEEIENSSATNQSFP